MLLLDRPTTAFAARVHLGAQAQSARTISRRSVPCLRSALRHAVLLRHGRHLVLNGTRRATCCCDPAYTLAESRSAELERTFGPRSSEPDMIFSRVALERAHYLHEQIKSAFWEELGSAGKQLVDWFGLVLEAVDPSPPPTGSYIHLLLTRYRREARRILFILDNDDDRSELCNSLRTLAVEEIIQVCRVLDMVGARAERERFYLTATSVVNESNPLTEFARLRGLVSKTLLKVSPDGYRMSVGATPDDIVKQMVERSSKILNDLTTRRDQNLVAV